MRALTVLFVLSLAGCLTSREDYLALLEHSMDLDDDGHRDPIWDFGDDCDDGDPAVHPGAEELCDEVDQDCDGEVDEGFDKAWYQDIDGDGHYSAVPVMSCEPPDDFARHAPGEDCDDRTASVYPDATEYCEGDDNDCDGLVDEGEAADAETFYLDADGDGYGDAATPIYRCEQPEDAVRDDSDCDDAQPTVHPGHEEVCNDHLDNDCDGTNNDCRRSGELSSLDADLVIYGPSAYGFFGVETCGVGDLDGDGVSELAIGAPLSGVGGRVYVIPSPLSEDSSAEAASAVISNDTDGCLGIAISHSPDITGDGSADLVLGDPCRDNGDTVEDGTVYALPAPRGNLTIGSSVMAVDGCCRGWGVGEDVDGTGDADGDGRPDLLVGAPVADYDGISAGAALYFFGPVPLRASVTDDAIMLHASSDGDEGGTSLAFVGDVDADGYDDVVVGEPGYDGDRGSANIASGPYREDTHFRTSFTMSVYGAEVGDRLGSSVSGAGDVNGDGYADVLVGSPEANARWLQPAGEVILVEGGPEVWQLSLETVTLTGQDDDHAGWSVSAAGDFDGDGYDDILIGAPDDGDEIGDDLGRAYLVYGPVARDMSLADADLIIQGEAASDFLGASVCGAQDLNGDGYPDLVIGAPGDSTNGAIAGAVYVVFGRGL